MARFRLRLQLHEVDLAAGETVLGRSPECHVTLEDPLVSRRHARIFIEGDRATIQDLGSRNGVRVNGELIDRPTQLRDGDRVRIGTHELVIHQAVQSLRAAGKSTGFLCYCAKCSCPYPEELSNCPHCGHEQRAAEETTLSGVVSTGRESWAVQLWVELLDRALALGRWQEAEQVLARVSAGIEERLQSGAHVEPSQLQQVADKASRIAQSLQASCWAIWLVQLYRRAKQLPHADIIARLRAIPLRADDATRLSDAMNETLRVLAAVRFTNNEERSGMQALERWHASLRQQGQAR